MGTSMNLSKFSQIRDKTQYILQIWSVSSPCFVQQTAIIEIRSSQKCCQKLQETRILWIFPQIHPSVENIVRSRSGKIDLVTVPRWTWRSGWCNKDFHQNQDPCETKIQLTSTESSRVFCDVHPDETSSGQETKWQNNQLFAPGQQHPSLVCHARPIASRIELMNKNLSGVLQKYTKSWLPNTQKEKH